MRYCGQAPGETSGCNGPAALPEGWLVEKDYSIDPVHFVVFFPSSG
jgi:hypothetical protein